MSGFDEKRAAEKQASRNADQRAVAEGRKSAEQVNRENSLAFGLTDRFRMRPVFGGSRAGGSGST